MKAVRFFTGLAIFVVFLIVSPCSAQDMSSLNIVTSPRAAGMGQCAINLMDQESAIYNPGALGLFHINKRVGFFFPVKSDYVPDLADDISPRLFGISIGDAYNINPESSENKGTFGAALAYSRFKIVMPVYFLTDELGRVIGTEQYYEKSNNFSFALGFDYWIRLGLGVNYKACEEGHIIITDRRHTYSARGTAYDFGLLAEFPLSRLLSMNQGGSGRALSFDLIPSVAYVNANNGDNLEIDGETSDFILPHISRYGLSILGTIDKNREHLASLRISYERKNDLVTDYGDISSAGIEIGFRAIVYLRMGKVGLQGFDKFTTVGAGLDLWVLLSQIYIRNHVPSNGAWYNRALRDVSLRIDYSHYNESEESPYSNSEFINIGLLF